jgi:TolB-like protein/Tfp pilus assembly protein PilF
MASLIPGYEYDIFISYRQKDNKGDRWVSEFVEALKTELESTFKEEISVYFDINPHDGLLETHDVDASLKDKLKCLIFIPIISRTYCDPKSFAWEHEFKAFVEQASKDQFGMKVKLPNGNVANRQIPIQIHDLYPEDKALVEKEIGGFIRAIEFIYKEPGVNRPLTAKDNEEKNSNKTNYRNQINKVANAIDEVIHFLRVSEAAPAGRRILYTQPLPDEAGGSKGKETEGETSISQKSKKWLIATFSVLLIIAGAFAVFKIIESRRKNKDIAKLEKSIAVLPFINDSPDQENTYFINGIMEEILNNLQKIKDFRVLSRSSTEQYRGTARPTIPEIAKKLNVNYILEGSGQKYGNTFRLRAQLIAAKNEKHMWGESFEKEIQSTKDIFKIQGDVAQAIAEALEASITPEEKQQIEKISTTNLTAYDFYLRGDEEIMKFWTDNYNINSEALRKAEEMYKKALTVDPTFAAAYAGLAGVYTGKQTEDSFFSKDYLDSVLIMADKALSFDDHLGLAYNSKAEYYLYRGNTEQAINEYNKALKYIPNEAGIYRMLGTRVYLWDGKYSDYIKAIENLLVAVSFLHGNDRAGQLYELGGAFTDFAGLPDIAKKYYDEAFQIDGDTSAYFMALSNLAYNSGDYEKALKLRKEIYRRDSIKIDNIGSMASIYYAQGKYKESLRYIKKIEDRIEAAGPFYMSGIESIGYVYWQNGDKEKADYWFKKQLRISEESNKLGRYISADRDTYYDLAAVYAFLGEKGKAYDNLREYAKIHICPWVRIIGIKNYPFFNSIRNEPEFQKIVSELEAKYQAEHERVLKWLEEQGKL